MELAQRQVDGPLQVVHQLLGMDVRTFLGEVPLLAQRNAIDVAQAFAEAEGEVLLRPGHPHPVVRLDESGQRPARPADGPAR